MRVSEGVVVEITEAMELVSLFVVLGPDVEVGTAYCGGCWVLYSATVLGSNNGLSLEEGCGYGCSSEEVDEEKEEEMAGVDAF